MISMMRVASAAVLSVGLLRATATTDDVCVHENCGGGGMSLLQHSSGALTSSSAKVLAPQTIERDPGAGNWLSKEILPQSDQAFIAPPVVYNPHPEAQLFAIESPPELILDQKQRLYTDPVSEQFPNKVEDTPESRKTMAHCHDAFQQSYDCHYVPPQYGGAKCDCFNNDTEILTDCSAWYGRQMSGSWLQHPRPHYSVKTGIYKETEQICLRAFRQAFECTGIDGVKGGSKGECGESCEKWYNSCLGGSVTTAAVRTGKLDFDTSN